MTLHSPKHTCRIIGPTLGIALLAGAASAQQTVYENEAEFLAEIANAGWETYTEGFEGPAWDGVRSPDPFNHHSAVLVTNLGVRWHARPGNLITTNHNWARDQRGWGIFEDQIQGFSASELFGETDRTIYAVSGWVNTNPDQSDIAIEVNGEWVDSVRVGAGHAFIGVIDTRGFTAFRIFDPDFEHVWGADDFTYAAPDAPQIELVLEPVCPDGGLSRLAWNRASPDGLVALLMAPSVGQISIPGNRPCPGTALGLSGQGLRIVYTGRTPNSGRKEMTVNVPPAACGSYLQMIDLGTCGVSAVWQVQ
jgi:hypothetical protein